MDEKGSVATNRHKLFLFSLYAVAYTVFYIGPNLRPNFPPVFLPLLKIDKTVPLIPWTFIVYVSAYPMVFFIIWILKDLQAFNSFCRRMFAGLFCCGMCFLLMPTQYPRPIYPSASSGVQLFMWLVRTADTPNNCFPSMHVAMTLIAWLSLKGFSNRTIATYGLWAAAICFSTLTTKQHYFYDVLGGTGVGILVTYLHYWFFESRSASKLAG